MDLQLDSPELQIDFAASLLQLRGTMLQEALEGTVRKSPLKTINSELNKLAPGPALSLLASKGIRGEQAFAVPSLLVANPMLLGYYRLLLGYSQKAFYSKRGIARFKTMEWTGLLGRLSRDDITGLCRALNQQAAALLEGVAEASLSSALLDDLALLTLGAQLRGGANVKKGARGILQVYSLIKSITSPSIQTSTEHSLIIKNSAGRKAIIELAPDPDIIIKEAISERDDSWRLIVAIEVKGGTDFSNVHNRVGEAEKSHQKARGRGFTECWTVLNVDRTNLASAKKESPSTDRFYILSKLQKSSGPEFEDFRNRISALVGIPKNKY